VKFPRDADGRTVTIAFPYLAELGVTGIDLGETELTTLPTLPSSVHTLDLSDTQMTTLPALPSSLRALYLKGALVATLPALPRDLQTLDRRST
jgi:E3 ubiquitin-protein ligase SspH2